MFCLFRRVLCMYGSFVVGFGNFLLLVFALAFIVFACWALISGMVLWGSGCMFGVFDSWFSDGLNDFAWDAFVRVLFSALLILCFPRAWVACSVLLLFCFSWISRVQATCLEFLIFMILIISQRPSIRNELRWVEMSWVRGITELNSEINFKYSTKLRRTLSYSELN